MPGSVRAGFRAGNDPWALRFSLVATGIGSTGVNAVRGIFLRFVGRLPVGRKLLLIYLLDLSAVIYVSGILINEKYIAINFARKEVAGSAYIAEVRDVLTGLRVPIVLAADGGLSLENAFFPLEGLLPDHVELVAADTATRLALEASR